VLLRRVEAKDKAVREAEYGRLVRLSRPPYNL
jgi:hypothetical protein